MFILPFLLYTYLINPNMSMPDTSYLTSMMSNITTNAQGWLYSAPQALHFPDPMDPKVDTLPLATFYFLTGAVFFFGTACMLAPRRSDRAIDGIATMSDFTKTSLRRHFDEKNEPYNRELRSILHSNGMEFDELIHRMLGNIKRTRRPVF